MRTPAHPKVAKRFDDVCAKIDHIGKMFRLPTYLISKTGRFTEPRAQPRIPVMLGIFPNI